MSLTTHGNIIVEFAYKDHLLLFNEKTRCLYALNHISRFIWRLYKRDMGLETIAASLTSRFAVSRQQALHDCKRIVAEWQRAGLLNIDKVQDTHQCLPVKNINNKKNATLSMQQCNSRYFNIAGRCVQLACHDQELMDAMKNILIHLQTTEHGSVDLKVSVCRNKDYFVIAVNDIPLHTTASHNEIIAWVHFELIAHSYRRRDCMAVLHSGAVYHDGAALLFPGSRGKGKSTLVAALQGQGFAYLCDDVCPLTGEQGMLIPVPLSQSLKSKSWPVLAHILPSLAEQPEQTIFGRSLKYIRPTTGATSLWKQTWPVGMLVFPEYQLQSPINQRRLTPLQALKQLIDSSSLFGDNIPSFLEWLEKTPCFSLRYSSLDEATAWIRSIAIDNKINSTSTCAEKEDIDLCRV